MTSQTLNSAITWLGHAGARPEIYVQGFPERRGKWLVSAGGGMFPQWRSDGKELYWRRPDGMLMAASVQLQAAGVRVGGSEPLFPVPGEFGFVRPWRDGRRFLSLEQEGQTEWPMTVIQNWASRLKK